jgi:hypothetical protein
MAIMINNSQPPVCNRHERQMVLCFWYRPGGPMGNGWSCPDCSKEREADTEDWSKTRFPEGAEL